MDSVSPSTLRSSEKATNRRKKTIFSNFLGKDERCPGRGPLVNCEHHLFSTLWVSCSFDLEGGGMFSFFSKGRQTQTQPLSDSVSCWQLDEWTFSYCFSSGSSRYEEWLYHLCPHGPVQQTATKWWIGHLPCRMGRNAQQWLFGHVGLTFAPTTRPHAGTQPCRAHGLLKFKNNNNNNNNNNNEKQIEHCQYEGLGSGSQGWFHSLTSCAMSCCLTVELESISNSLSVGCHASLKRKVNTWCIAR